VEGGGEELGEAVGGGGGKALVEGLGGEVGAEVGGEFGEVFERGLGVVEPSEDEGLDEDGSGEFALALNEVGVACGLFGFAGKEGLQGVSQCGKNSHRRPLGVGVCQYTTILHREGLFSCATLNLMPMGASAP
jgi:hypothetical protein